MSSQFKSKLMSVKGSISWTGSWEMRRCCSTRASAGLSFLLINSSASWILHATRTALGHRGSLTNRLAVRWACRGDLPTWVWWARRLEIVRTFAKHFLPIEPKNPDPATALVGAGLSSSVPAPPHRRANPATSTKAPRCRCSQS